MKKLRVSLANGYHFLLGPLYRRLRVEMDEKIEAVNKLERDKFAEELKRVHQANLQRQERFVKQVSEEIVRLNQRVSAIELQSSSKADPSLMHELVKIHQALEALKHGIDDTR